MKTNTTAQDITSIIWNSLDLVGSWADEVKDYCKEEMLEFNSKQVQNICFIAVARYQDEDMR